MKKVSKKTITNLFNSILTSGQKEALDKFPELNKSFKDIGKKSPEDFNLDFYYPINGIIRNTLAEACKKGSWDNDVSSLVFLYTEYHYIKGHLEQLIKIKEGSACSADKSRFLIASLVRHYAVGQSINMTRGKKCYWKPHFWTGKVWIEFFETIQHLYYGNYSKYMIFLQKNWMPLLKTTDAVKKELHKK